MFPNRRALDFMDYVLCPTLAINAVPLFLPYDSYRFQLTSEVGMKGPNEQRILFLQFFTVFLSDDFLRSRASQSTFIHTQYLHFSL